MVNCVQLHQLVLLHSECSSVAGIIKKAVFLFREDKKAIQLYFCHSNGQETHIESDSDLLALRYMVGKESITFEVRVSKSQKQIEGEIISEAVEEYLGETYEEVAEQEFQREVSQEIEKYLVGLYKKLEQKEMLKRIQEEEVERFMTDMTSEIVGKKTTKCIPPRERRERRSRMVRVSPEKEMFKRKDSTIETMVSRVLESMMPVMVKELSYRIVEELKMESPSSTRSEMASRMFESHLNPEEL